MVIKILLAVCCSFAALGCSEPGGDTRSSALRVSRSETPDRAELSTAMSFYDNNDTYIADPVDDGFWTTSTPAAQGLHGGLLNAGASSLNTKPAILSFLVIRNGFLVKEHYFHGSAANHSNNIHSASKGFLSALVGLLIQHGYVQSLDESLSTLLPGLTYSSPQKANITLRHLLTMSAGFDWVEDETEYEIEDEPSWVQAIVNLPLKTSPGQKFHYCTGQSHIVSAVIAEKTGMTTQSFAEQYLFGPMGITVEHWGNDPQGYNSGGYNFYVTPRTLAKLALLVLNQGQQGGQQILPAAWTDDSVTPKLKVDNQYKYGYYWWLLKIGGRSVYKLWGWGGQLAYLIPDADMVVVITSDTQQWASEINGDKFIKNYVVPAIVN